MPGKGSSKGGGSSKSGSAGKPNTNKPIWVQYDADGKEWRAEREGGQRALTKGERKKEVVDRAREIAQNTESELIITKKEDHTVHQRESYGNDPNPPRDTEH